MALRTFSKVNPTIMPFNIDRHSNLPKRVIPLDAPFYAKR